jgi:SPP1 gp7 family putative phage head morphogenesis protein
MSNKRNRVAKAIQPPFKAQNYYYKELLKLLEDMERDINKKLSTIADSSTEEGIFGVLMEYVSKIPLYQKIALKFVNLINTTNEKKYKKGLENIGIKEIIDADVSKLLARKREYNVGLIKSIPQKMHDRLLVKLAEAFENGNSIQDILSREFDISKNRAKLIARDQTAKINSDLYEHRAVANGSYKYIWRTSADERVRSEHQKLNGKKFRWDEGSPCCGHPSSDVNCRCLARAVYSSP